MDILIALIPALGWGIMPILATKMGGKPANQIVGTAAGAFILGVLTFLVVRPDLSAGIFALSALSGAAWVVGQIGQYTGLQRIGVSRTMPISAGLQLIGTSLIGVMAFGEWPSAQAKIIGFAGLLSVLAGILLISLKSEEKGCVDKSTILMIFLTNFGFLVYSTIPKIGGGNAGPGIFFPQACGMIAASVAYVVLSKKAEVLKQKTTWKNILPGLAFATAALTYIISAQMNGVATAFVLSQLSVIISTILGIVILKEERKGKALAATIIGLILVAAGGMATASL